MSINPTQCIDVNFNNYLSQRNREQASHLVNGIPDYSFSLDQKLLQQLKSMTPIRIFARAFTEWMVPFQKQLLNLDCVAVSPSQFPEIFSIAEDCARRLGIGIPKIFVKYDPYMNASTYCYDDANPVMIIHSSLIETMSNEELRAVIGHECGHIHNNHGIYHTAGQMIAQLGLTGGIRLFPGLAQIVQFLSFGAQMMLMRWSRCSEITSDRAAAICADNPKTAMMSLAKLGFGGIDKLKGVNMEEYIKQLDGIQSTPVRFMELTYDHPLIPKRLEALRIFSRCDVLYSWRQDLKVPGADTISKSQADQQCEQFIQVKAKGYKGWKE